MSDALLPYLNQCPGAYSSFAQNCLPQTYDFDGITSVIKNVINGRCIRDFSAMLGSCIPLQTVQKADMCFSNTTGFLSCLPGHYADYTPKPSRCLALSWIAFVINEAMVLVKNPRWKVAFFFSTQGIRALESYLCLPNCKAYKDRFWVMGKREWPMEIERYSLSGVGKLLRSLDPKITQTFDRVVRVVKHPFSQFLSAMVPALIQQGLRNRDFIEGYQVCEPKKAYTIGMLKYYSARFLGVDSSDIANTLYQQLILPLQNGAKAGGAMVLNGAIAALNQMIQMLSQASIELARFFFWLFFQENSLSHFINEQYATLREQMPGYEVIQDQLREVLSKVGELKTCIEEKISSYFPKQDPRHINPFTGRPNSEHIREKPDLEEKQRALMSALTGTNFSMDNRPREAESLSAEQTDSLLSRAHQMALDVLTALESGPDHLPSQ